MSKEPKDSLGQRIKDCFELPAKTSLMRKVPVIVRIDGKAFHTFCKRFKKPYDNHLNEALNKTLEYLCKNIQGAKFGQRHSDEMSILLTDFATEQTDAYFDYQVQKICSVTAAMATAEFCRQLMKFGTNFDYISIHKEESWPTFDSRCFNLPLHEISNYFWWRMLDAKRGSINMLAQYHFSHKKLQNLNCDQMQELLFQEKNINWNDLPQEQKTGFICTKEITKKIVEKGPNAGQFFERSVWSCKPASRSIEALRSMFNT